MSLAARLNRRLCRHSFALCCTHSLLNRVDTDTQKMVYRANLTNLGAKAALFKGDPPGSVVFQKPVDRGKKLIRLRLGIQEMSAVGDFHILPPPGPQPVEQRQRIAPG